MSETLVKVENVSKKFCRSLKRSLWYGVQDIGAELVGRRFMQAGNAALRPDEFWAVKDTSFELQRGDCLGLIGRNGAGKSTLLKMLNGLIKPDTGRIEMHGRIGALIELGTGFNPILTGRENVYVNGSILGFGKKEIDRKFEAILDFAEIGEFIDMPVKNYSSGMKVRLGFAVAAQMEPDVLLVDEVLAVGDVGFRIKCYNEIYRIMERAAVIFVSHSMSQIGKVCTRGILMANGSPAVVSSNVAEVIGAYYDLFGGENITTEGNGKAHFRELIFGNPDNPIRLNGIHGLDAGTEYQLDIDQKVCIQLSLDMDSEINDFFLLYFFIDVDQKIVAQTIPSVTPIHNGGGALTINVELDRLLLNTGKYTLTFQVLKSSYTDRGEVLLGVRNIIRFSVRRNMYIGAAPILYEARWMCQSSNQIG